LVNVEKNVAIERGTQMVVFNLTNLNSTGTKEFELGFEQWNLTPFWKHFACLAIVLPYTILNAIVTLNFIKFANAETSFILEEPGTGLIDTAGTLLEASDFFKDLYYFYRYFHSFVCSFFLAFSITLPFSCLHIIERDGETSSYGPIHTVLILLGLTSSDKERSAR
jgi:hypothetical protein